MSKFIIILLPMRLIYTIVNLEDKATSASFLRKFRRSHRSQKTLLGSEGNRGIFLGINMVFCKFYEISSLKQYKPSKILILGTLKFDLEIGKKYLDAKTCFIDSLMTCCVFLACKLYEINTFNFSEIISVCSNDSFGNSNPKPQYFRKAQKFSGI